MMCTVSDDGPMLAKRFGSGAVVRKPSGKEPAGNWGWAAVPRYGDFAVAVRAFAGGCCGTAGVWALGIEIGALIAGIVVAGGARRV